MPQPREFHSWQEAWQVYAQPRVIGMIFPGFAVGLPLLLVFSTLSAWLRDESTACIVIGFFSWVGVNYSIKVFWMRVGDRPPLSLLARSYGVIVGMGTIR